MFLFLTRPLPPLGLFGQKVASDSQISQTLLCDNADSDIIGPLTKDRPLTPIREYLCTKAMHSCNSQIPLMPGAPASAKMAAPFLARYSAKLRSVKRELGGELLGDVSRDFLKSQTVTGEADFPVTCERFVKVRLAGPAFLPSVDIAHGHSSPLPLTGLLPFHGHAAPERDKHAAAAVSSKNNSQRDIGAGITLQPCLQMTSILDFRLRALAFVASPFPSRARFSIEQTLPAFDDDADGWNNWQEDDARNATDHTRVDLSKSYSSRL
ncbi:hypothetical protein WN48_05916 [Eufriesea mexicana]|uniref:Uncharacterized protein n=1 Tax=Eufriesea mexicana TaxID=516756 RepID=A0A310SKE7_9HYME|nr:hypothetical protein WN48_05916 [Eufriesea mexicana]